MLKFIIDTQLPPKLASHLDNLGTEAIHTTHYLEGHKMADSKIIQIAIDDDRIIISKDADFRDHFLIKGIPPKILLLKTGNISNKNLIKLLTNSFSKIEQLFEDDNGMVILGSDTITGYKTVQ